MTRIAALSAIALAIGLAAPAAAFVPAAPAGLPGALPSTLPVDHSDRTETHGCLCDDWFLGMLGSETRPLALASVDPRHQTARRDFGADAGSLAETRHLNHTLLPRLLRVEYDFDRKPGDAVLLLAGTGAVQTGTGICRVRVGIANLGDRELPDIAYLWDFDWSVPGDEIAGQIHLAGLAPISGQGLAAGPAGLPACTGPSDADLLRFFASGAPIPQPARISGGSGFAPVQLATLTTPPGTRGLPTGPTPPVLSFTPVGGGGSSSSSFSDTPEQSSSQHDHDPGNPGGGPNNPQTPVSPVPLPASLWLLLGGLGLLMGGRRVFLGRTAAG